MAGSKKETSTKSVAAETSREKTAPRKVRRGSSAADVVDEQLARYRSMRNFSVTEEPSGGLGEDSEKGLPFCVQKHAASHLHYDFRLGWNGVLKSWAVSKGPSYVTSEKRLAVQVEDHPIEYGGFEGVIPKGQYGGGTVMLWDQGTWEPQPSYPDVEAGLRDGSLKFLLHGTKLKGKWALIRMGGKWAKEKKPNWLLIKEHDEYEQSPNDVSITESEQKSVVTGRTMDEIAQSEDHVWNSKQTRSTDKAWFRKDETSTATNEKSEHHKQPNKSLKKLPQENQPAFIPPQLATMAEVPPSEAGWLHELKLDGYRMQVRKDGSRVQLLTRTGLDWTARAKSIAKEIEKIPADHATLDGELVVVAPNGTTSFADLQASMQEGAKHDLTYFAFDLVHLDGRNTRGLTLKERKELLAELLAGNDGDRVRVSEHIETGGAELLREACKLQAEGIVSKRASSKYTSDRSSDWIKTKCLHEQEFVVGGYTLPSNNIRGVGALLLGYFKGGKLIYAGRTGTGFTQKTHRLLRDQLEKLASETDPFVAVSADARKGVRWVSPTMVAQIRFASWTADNLVRQAAFLGVREDKDAKEVVREEADTTIGPRRSRAEGIKASKDTSTTKTTHKAGTKLEISERAPVRLTHPQKLLDEISGMTKQMLADYYWAVADWMLPLIANRPVSLVRCPEGSGKPCFFQKHVNSMLPKGVGGVDIADKKGKVEPYITLNTAEALAGLAQMGVLELHPWGSVNDDLEHPDRLIFDLDPDEDLEWKHVTRAAEDVRARLKELSLESFVKTTGGKGLHIVVPVEPHLAWPEFKEFARSFVAAMEKTYPERYLTKMTKSARKGKIYLDYLRNERGATSVAAYSPRARAGAPVSMPLSWAELKASNERPVYHVADLPKWKARLKDDPWQAINRTKQTIQL
jgi:bifunctional non-homologous end joining protein LigD